MSWDRSRAAHPPGWAALRKQVLVDAHYECGLGWVGCLGVASEVDHIMPVAFGGVYELNNLRAVCRNCHRKKSLGDIQQGRQRRAGKLRRPPLRHPAL